jgi:thioredoxin 1
MKHIKNSIDLKELIEKNEVVIVDFYTSWCGPCKTIAPFFEKLSKEYPQIAVAKCDCENSDDVADGFGIKAIPTFIKFVNGKRDTVVNGCDKTKLIELFNGL